MMMMIIIGLSRTVSEINGDFSRKSPNVPTHVYLTPPLNGFSLELGIGARGQKVPVMGLPDGRKRFKIGLVV